MLLAVLFRCDHCLITGRFQPPFHPCGLIQSGKCTYGHPVKPVALTDDCGAVERLGIGVSLTQGDYCNLKITTPEDLAVAEALFAWREQQ